MRLIKSVADPRAYLHIFKLINYYNYSHVAPLRVLKKGQGVAISPNVVFANAERITLGDRVTLKQAMDEADITIGNDVWIGAKAMVLPGAVIGDGAIIGGGAIVRGEIPPFAIAVGAPAKVVGTRSRPANL